MERELGPADPFAATVGDAAAAASVETADAIDKAATINDDPEVAHALDQAAIAADKTVSRLGWIQRFLHRHFPRPGS